MKTAAIFPVLTLVLIASVSAIPMPANDSGWHDTGSYNNYWPAPAQRNFYRDPNRFSIYDPSTASASTYHYNAVPLPPPPPPTPTPTQQPYPVPLGGGQSFVWQSQPGFAYGIEQTHPQLYRNRALYYPNGINYAW